MQIDFLLAISVSLICFLLGWLFALRASLLYADKREVESVHRAYNTHAARETLKNELWKMTDLYVREKQRSAFLLGKLRAANRLLRSTKPWGKSVFTDPSLITAHMLRQFSAGAVFTGVNCWKCKQRPATTRLGDTMYCADCANERAAP